MENINDTKFPMGMRVLVVDDDRLCLMLIEKLLQRANYNVTVVLEPNVALEMLRARKQEGNQFHLVIADVHMPGMDGLKLLELISLDTDVPVIMLSADDELETMEKSIKQGACNYMVKPVRFEQVKNLWLHVVKKGINDCSDGGEQKLQSWNIDDEEKCAKKTRNYSRKKKKIVLDNEVDNANTSTHKRKRIQWSGELHSRFVEVVDCIGLDRAVPKKILKMMNVPSLRRENVASHLQKYKMYLKKVSLGTFKLSNPFAKEVGWKKLNHINLNGEIYTHKPTFGTQPTPRAFCGSINSDKKPFACMNITSGFGTRNTLLPPTELVQPVSAQRNLVIPQNDLVPFGQDGSRLKDVTTIGLQHDASQLISFGNSHINMLGGSKMIHYGPSGSSIANSSHATEFHNTRNSSPSGTCGIMLANISEGSPPQVKSNDLSSYASILRRNILGASKGIPIDEDDEFQSIVDGCLLASTSLVPLHSPELTKHHSVEILPSSANLFKKIATKPSQFSTLSINMNKKEASVPLKFDGIGKNRGTIESPLQENNLMVNQFLELTTTSSQIPDFGNESHNQMDIAMSEETTPMVGLSYQQTASVNSGSSTTSTVMLNNNSALGSASNNIYKMPNHEGGSGNLAKNVSTNALQVVADEFNKINDEPLQAPGKDVANDFLDGDFFIDFNDDFLTSNNAFMDGDLMFDL